MAHGKRCERLSENLSFKHIAVVFGIRTDMALSQGADLEFSAIHSIVPQYEQRKRRRDEEAEKSLV